MTEFRNLSCTLDGKPYCEYRQDGGAWMTTDVAQPAIFFTVAQINHALAMAEIDPEEFWQWFEIIEGCIYSRVWGGKEEFYTAIQYMKARNETF